MKKGGHNYHPANVPGRTKFLLNLELQRQQEEDRIAAKKKKKGMVETVRELFKGL